MHEEIDRADGDRTAAVQNVTDADGEHVARRQHHRHHVVHQPVAEGGFALLLEHVRLQVEQAAQRVGHRAQGAHVLGAAELLFDEAEQPGGGFTARFLVGHGDVTHGVEGDERDEGKAGESQPGGQVLTEQGNQDAEQEQQVAEQGDDELREEVCHLCHVAVDALDQLAGGVLIMEAEVEVQAVPGKVQAQGVGGVPGDRLADIRHRDGDDLLQDGDADEQQGGAQQGLLGLLPQGGVDEVAHHLRVDHLQRDGEEHQEH